MAKLLIFAPCEKVVISNEDNAASLISILQGFNVPMQPPQDQTALAPVTWYVFTLWERETDDAIEDRQRFELHTPTGELLLQGEAPILRGNELEKIFHRTASKIAGFPIKGEFGAYTLTLSTRKAHQSEFTDVAVFPIPIALIQEQ